jgi:hypothetical protein
MSAHRFKSDHKLSVPVITASASRTLVVSDMPITVVTLARNITITLPKGELGAYVRVAIGITVGGGNTTLVNIASTDAIMLTSGVLAAGVGIQNNATLGSMVELIHDGAGVWHQVGASTPSNWSTQ